MDIITVGFALTGSFCTFERAIEEMKNIKSKGMNVIPIMSYNAFSTDTRFGKSNEINTKIEEICESKYDTVLTEVRALRKALEQLEEPFEEFNEEIKEVAEEVVESVAQPEAVVLSVSGDASDSSARTLLSVRKSPIFTFFHSLIFLPRFLVQVVLLH